MDDKQLTALFAGDLPPVQDARFTLGVLARMEQRHFRREMGIILALAAAAALLLALLMPTLDFFWRDSGGLLGNAVIAMTLADPDDCRAAIFFHQDRLRREEFCDRP